MTSEDYYVIWAVAYP